MCSAPSMPKPDPAAVAAANKKPQYMKNPWLDGLAIQGSGTNQGRNSLVIDNGSGGSQNLATAPMLPPTHLLPPPSYSSGPGLGLVGGGGGGAGGGGRGSSGRVGTGVKTL